MKTPEQIAFDTYWTLSDSLLPDSPTGDDYRRVMRLAIEADRAQRAEDISTVIEAARSWANELNEYVIPAASEEEARGHEVQAQRIADAIAALTQKEN